MARFGTGASKVPGSGARTRRRRWGGWCSALALGGLALVVPADSVAAQWTITDLGALGGTFSNGRAINRGGEAVGRAYAAGNASYHAFLFDGRKMADLGTLGGTDSTALGVNDQGWVAGSSYLAGDAAEHAFLYLPARGMVDLGTLGGANSTACAISNRGEVAGFSEVAGGSAPHAFLYRHGRMQDLGVLGGPASAGRALNDHGWVAFRRPRRPRVSRLSLPRPQTARPWHSGRHQQLGPRH